VRPERRRGGSISKIYVQVGAVRKRLILLIAACVIVVAAAILIFHPRQRQPVEAAPGPAAAQVAVAQQGSITHLLGMAGQFQAYQVVDVHPKVSGFIHHIYVDIGDRVHEGQTLAVLEVPELRAELAGTVAGLARSKDEITQSEHEVARAEAEYSALHANSDRLQQASKAQPGLIAQQELDDAQSKDLAAAAQVDAAKSALAAARGGSEVARADNERVSALENYTNVIAPLSGVVTWRYADTGALIQSGRDSNDQALPIVKISENGLLRLRMPVPEDAVRYIKAGDPIEIRVDALGRSFTGKVVRFTRDVNFETRTMQTEVDVENKDLSIVPGMYANAQLVLAHAENVLTIPVEALLLRGSKRVVYVLDSGNHVHERVVEIGLEGAKLAEIKSGLKQGERVISGGQGKYQEGEQVEPVVTKEPSSETMRASESTIDTQQDQGEDRGGPQ
jgi:RND family efflux transporter MFP subunit